MSSKKSKVTDKDLYEFLGIPSTASEKEIRSAYRKKALTCHPDKNPDDPNATALFRELSEAFEVLICPTAKAAYDQVLKGRAAAKIRTKELDSKRRKLKEDLERREKASATRGVKRKSDDDVPDELKLQREIERLRKEGHQTLLREQEAMRQEMFSQQKPKPTVVSDTKAPPPQSFEDFEAMVLRNLAAAAAKQKESRETTAEDS